MERPIGIQVFKTVGSHSPAVEYLQPTSNPLNINSVCAQGSTMGGHFGVLTTQNIGTDVFKCVLPLMEVTSGTSTTNYPCHRLNTFDTFIVGQCSSISTSAISSTYSGLAVYISSSGGACAATAGQFRITTVYNTSDYSNQLYTGQFIGAATTV